MCSSKRKTPVIIIGVVSMLEVYSLSSTIWLYVLACACDAFETVHTKQYTKTLPSRNSSSNSSSSRTQQQDHINKLTNAVNHKYSILNHPGGKFKFCLGFRLSFKTFSTIFEQITWIVCHQQREWEGGWEADRGHNFPIEKIDVNDVDDYLWPANEISKVSTFLRGFGMKGSGQTNSKSHLRLIHVSQHSLFLLFINNS